MALLEVKDLKTYFHTRSGIVKGVDGVSFSIEKGETLGIVGESGSGKSVTMMSLMGLLPTPPAKIESGTAMFGGQDLLKLSDKEMRKIRGNKISMIFQDPMTSLNPYMKISKQLTEVLEMHKNVTRREAKRKAIEILEKVNIPDAASRVDNYPHQFSGGMRQRVMIAMALISEPELLIADEPTTALDVTIQAQILELLKDLQKDLGMAMVMITHDLGVVAGVSDNILVMYAGRPVERGTADEIFYHHAHPYTRGLLKSLPKIDGERSELYSISGLPPDPSNLPPGCPFAPRCDYATDDCRADKDIIEQTGVSPGHIVKCTLDKGKLDSIMSN
jgi:oligopeptide transport system ATP-binding protein